MWRAAVLVLAVLCLAAGAIAALAGAAPSAFGLVVLGLLVLIGTLYERVRYKHIETHAPGAGWVKTAERFIDDETGRPVTVYVHPASGARKYVHD
jgi:hypothetical protein